MEIINSLLKPGDVYFEPFVGSGKVIQNVRSDAIRYGNDADPYIVALLEAVQRGWEPPDEVSEEKYAHLKKLSRVRKPYEYKRDTRALIAFAGYACSFGARFFEGYARSKTGTVNFAASAKKSLLRQKPLLKDVYFTIADFQMVDIFRPPGLVYADPPYEGTKPVGFHKLPFDSDRFWKWAERQVESGWTVLISEYQCPIKSAVVLWEKNVSAGIRFGTKGDGGAIGSGKKKSEKLYALGKDVGKDVGLGLY